MAKIDENGKIFVGKSRKPDDLTLRLARPARAYRWREPAPATAGANSCRRSSRAGVPVFAADIKGDLSVDSRGR